MTSYPLKSILLSFSKPNGAKRIIYNSAPIGGMSSTMLSILFFLMPFALYAMIFNPYVFEKLGIATAIIFFIVFSSVLMMIIFAIIIKVKKNIIKKIKSSWNKYFEDIDLDMVLSVGITPYSNFFEYYSKIAKENLSEQMLHNSLEEAFKTMQEDNKELIEAINKSKNTN